MSSSSDDERAAFLARWPQAPRSPSPLSLDDPLDPTAGLEEGRRPNDILLLKPEHQRQRSSRRRRCSTRHFALRLCSRRTTRRICAFALKYTLLLLLALALLTPILAPSYLSPPAHYDELAARCDSSAQGPGANTSGCANPNGEKVFISVSLYDKDGHLAGGSWGETILELIHLLGPHNTFLSIYENDSGAAGAAALERLRRAVPCRHEIVYEDHVPLDIFPTVTLPDGSTRTKRLAYLSEMRNRALRPLDTLGGVGGVKFDKVLFLNDVAFRPVDAAQLLFSTNAAGADDGRARYLSACALDWKTPFLFYDVYAQRDAQGFSNGLPLFPVFSGAGDGASRSDMLAQKDAVRVQACWGGMVAMQAAYVQNLAAALPRPDFQAVDSHVVDPARPTPVAAPVRFRYEPEIFFDACECCLFLADVSQAARAAGAATEAETGVFVNPYVRVAYDKAALPWVRRFQRWERLFAIPQAIISRLASLPTHNPHREVREGDTFVEEVWDNATNAWTLATRTGRSGMFCGTRGMQLIQQEPRTGDKNWANAVIPPGQALNFPT